MRLCGDCYGEAGKEKAGKDGDGGEELHFDLGLWEWIGLVKFDSSCLEGIDWCLLDEWFDRGLRGYYI